MSYPDDVRQYDNDPRSPFYSPLLCPYCGEEAEERDGGLWCPVCDEEDDDE
jgi:transposase